MEKMGAMLTERMVRNRWDIGVHGMTDGVSGRGGGAESEWRIERMGIFGLSLSKSMPHTETRATEETRVTLSSQCLLRRSAMGPRRDRVVFLRLEYPQVYDM